MVRHAKPRMRQAPSSYHIGSKVGSAVILIRHTSMLTLYPSNKHWNTARTESEGGNERHKQKTSRAAFEL